MAIKNDSEGGRSNCVIVFNEASNAYDRVTPEEAPAFCLQSAFKTARDLRDEAPAFRPLLRRAGRELAALAGGRFIIGRDKDMDRILQKADGTEFGVRRVTDAVRGMIPIDSPEQMAVLRRELNAHCAAGPARFGGARLISFEDNVACPMKNGMRRLMLRLEMERDGERHVGEIQVRIHAMEAAEELTHDLYKIKRHFEWLLPRAERDVAAELGLHILACDRLIKSIHDSEAHTLGYDDQIEGDYRRGMPLDDQESLIESLHAAFRDIDSAPLPLLPAPALLLA